MFDVYRDGTATFRAIAVQDAKDGMVPCVEIDDLNTTLETIYCGIIDVDILNEIEEVKYNLND